MKYLYIFGPEVSAKTMIDRFYFLTNLESFMKIGLSVFEKTCQEKKDDNRGKET